MEKLKQDDILELVIDGYGMDGEGVAHADDNVIFVPFAMKGERVKAKVTYVKRNLVFCDLKEILRPSPLRVYPDCNRFPKCGGCDILHVGYEEQLCIKKDNIKTLFRKNVGYEPEIDDVVPSPKQLAYRNKIQLPFGTVNGKVAVGFFRENSHKIVSITKCFLHGDWVEKLIGVFLSYAEKFGLTAYDEYTKNGVLRHLVARYIGGKYCIVVVTNNCPLPHTKELVSMLKETIGEDFSLYYSPKVEHNNVIMGKTVVPIKESPFIIDVLGIKVSLNPFSFLQLNDDVRDLIYTAVADRIPDGSTVIDAYAGVGILGATLAKRGARVYNIEIVPEATADGNVLAKQNGLEDKITNINGDAALILPQLLEKLNLQEKVYILLDPPRKGISSEVVAALNKLSCPVDLIYISCNPATLTRDLKLLSASYTIEKVTPYDMFPQTKHVETLVQLSHKTPDSHIVVKVDFDKDNSIQTDTLLKNAQAYKPAERVTYKMIQAYVEEKYGFKVHTAYIAEVKRSYGLPMYDAPNAVEELKRPRQHPSEKMVEAIKDALKHFDIV